MIFKKIPPEQIENPDTILHVVQKYREDIHRKFPRFSDHLVRLTTVALAIFCMRNADMRLREHALMPWIIEGEKNCAFMKVIAMCYIQVEPFKDTEGVPPDSSRMHHFLLELEGLFRRLDLQRAIHEMWCEAGEDDTLFASKCVKSAVGNVTWRRVLAQNA